MLVAKVKCHFPYQIIKTKQAMITLRGMAEHRFSNLISNTEDGLRTGILIWDLSAAFDTLSTELLCQKQKNYGFDTTKLTFLWYDVCIVGSQGVDS